MVHLSNEESSQPVTAAQCLYDLLAARAQAQPTAAAISAPGRVPLTYQRLLESIHKVAATLTAMGVERQSRVALVLPNGPEMALSFLAVTACATCAPLNPSYRAGEFDFYLSDLEAKALILPAGEPSPAREVAKERGIPLIELHPCMDAEAGRFTLSGTTADRQTPVAFAQPDDIALVLHTSGTTSRPKIVPLTQRNICISAEHIRASLALTEQDRCLNIMPLFHIHGLIGALLSSLTAGAGISCTPGFYAPQFYAWMEESAPTWYTAVPTMQQAILSRAEANMEIVRRHPLRFIRSCSASLPPQLMAALEETFHTPVIEAYGMTEAAHQIASNPLPPRAHKPGSVGIAAGPDVAIMDDAGALLPAGVTGEIVIRGANVTPGYANNPTANQSAFTHGWFRTGDQGYLDQDGYVFLTGRIKEIINRGGEKIAPREIDEALLDHAAVAQAVTFAIPHPQLGEEIAAAVVLREGATVMEQELRTFVAGKLADFKVPCIITFLSEIPKGPTGKIQRIGLAEKLELTLPASTTPAVRAEYAPPRTPIETLLAELWAQVLKVEQVGIHDHFLQLGGDSILATQLVARVREALRTEISLIEFFAAPTIAQQALVLVTHQADAAAEDEMAAMLAELESLSDDEVRRITAEDMP